MVPISRRQPPIHLSAIPFCHGESDTRRLELQTRGFQYAMTSTSNFTPRSRITQRYWPTSEKVPRSLLHNPVRCRITSHIENARPYDVRARSRETVQQLKGHGRYRKEIETDDHLAMVLEKR